MEQGTRWKRLRLGNQPDKPAFELLVLGCGGGPVGSNLSSYLVKPAAQRWSEGCIGLEAGSTLGAIVSLAERDSTLFADFFPTHEHDTSMKGERRSDGVDETPQESERDRKARALRTGGVVWDAITASVTTAPRPVPARRPRSSRQVVLASQEGEGRAFFASEWTPSSRRLIPAFETPVSKADTLRLRFFVITHGHLDHIAGLVISSALCRPQVKPIYGVEHTIANIERAMDGGVWPVLGAREKSKEGKGLAYQYRVIEAPISQSIPLSSALSFSALPVAHGPNPSTSVATPASLASHSKSDSTKSSSDVYHSTAVFLREEVSKREFLFFGDVEPDSVSGTDLNRKVWTAAASKIVAGSLDVIFIECSYPSSQPRAQLFGHLSPPYVMEELAVLEELVVASRGTKGGAADAKGGPLAGVTVVITHIKDELYLPPPDTAPSSATSDPTTSAAAASIEAKYPRERETVHERIERELNELERERGTGVRFVLAEQGMRLEI
ncbi:putative 3',5'-cyclic-AMP phosphodiesterase [Rhodotorula taiwanensis]|uniref:Putative 3',5'-cyclic-AMP phosphodiesterase n=1 Tax=Rhodotorula taiwanensis TaxID=741276 RepID=A0A2S5B2H4_9BASI|nr:putative 3',5'-cyclic-AMP phosphodiesterase [Rhodotorula taiwanensis]